MEPIVSKSLPVSLNQHRSHGPIFSIMTAKLTKSTLQCAQTSGEHPILHRKVGFSEAHRLLPEVAVRWWSSRYVGSLFVTWIILRQITTDRILSSFWTTKIMWPVKNKFPGS